MAALINSNLVYLYQKVAKIFRRKITCTINDELQLSAVYSGESVIVRYTSFEICNDVQLQIFDGSRT